MFSAGGGMSNSSSAASTSSVTAGINVGGFNVPQSGFKPEQAIIAGAIIIMAIMFLKK